MLSNILLSDCLLIAPLVGLYVIISRLSFAKIPCPEHLQPKNNKDKKTKDYFDYYGNYISMFHAITSLALSAYALSTEGLIFGIQTTLIMKLVAYNSMGYFIADTILSIYYGYLNPAMAVHHIASIICAGTVFYTQSCGAEQALGLLIGESSNPCNLYREILKHQKKDNSKLYFQMSAGFVATFVIARFVIAPFYLTQLYAAPTAFPIKFMIALVWFVSWHWLFIIINFGIKALRDALGEDPKSGKSNAFNSAYALISKVRKNKPFMTSYYIGAAWLSFGTLYLAHWKA
jgi:hypothetical protein